jgi:hypothetical protein
MNDCRAKVFPALYSHCVIPQISVHDAVDALLENQLRPRLTRFAAGEKTSLLCLLPVHLTVATDERSLALFPGKPFTSRNALKALQSEHSEDRTLRVYGAPKSQLKSNSLPGYSTIDG